MYGRTGARLEPAPKYKTMDQAVTIYNQELSINHTGTAENVSIMIGRRSFVDRACADQNKLEMQVRGAQTGDRH